MPRETGGTRGGEKGGKRVGVGRAAGARSGAHRPAPLPLAPAFSARRRADRLRAQPTGAARPTGAERPPGPPAAPSGAPLIVLGMCEVKNKSFLFSAPFGPVIYGKRKGVGESGESWGRARMDLYLQLRAHEGGKTPPYQTKTVETFFFSGGTERAAVHRAGRQSEPGPERDLPRRHLPSTVGVHGRSFGPAAPRRPPPPHPCVFPSQLIIAYPAIPPQVRAWG